MPSTDPATDTGEPRPAPRSAPGGDLGRARPADARGPGGDHASGAPQDAGAAGAAWAAWDTSNDDTLDLRLPPDLTAAEGDGPAAPGDGPAAPGDGEAPPGDGPPPSELLGAIADWPPVTCAAGAFQLVPVRLGRDLPVITRWMNDPAVHAFWGLAGPPERTGAHLRGQLDGDGRSVPCLGVLDGVPMSYWEIYRADLDPLARHFPTRPHDTGVHLLIGPAERRGRGLGTALLRATAELLLRHRPECHRVLAEPDVRNAASVSAFRAAGFRVAAEIDLPDKRAALVVRDREAHAAP
ncbi:GNAT family N-acetyltransferase [Streptomyces sp. TRM 70351]|uniref:GNAT family N-acetyltransferase n=1 Tax=Streptomyces sp. TRM 70351 TaxID=3116552 RepID=UPI002E7AD869|nr:GNAT family N-acetyltransferase [Streptomyces sp. TRM 70351]MEE1926621.1 GNAT family N-acetyltransferase [Streptomyces sp. TRM 70351]